MGFELITPVFELAKTVHALDRAATVIGKTQKYDSEMISFIHSVWSGLWEL
jgi:hypothetical protein